MTRFLANLARRGAGLPALTPTPSASVFGEGRATAASQPPLIEIDEQIPAEPAGGPALPTLAARQDVQEETRPSATRQLQAEPLQAEPSSEAPHAERAAVAVLTGGELLPSQTPPGQPAPATAPRRPVDAWVEPTTDAHIGAPKRTPRTASTPDVQEPAGAATASPTSHSRPCSADRMRAEEQNVAGAVAIPAAPEITAPGLRRRAVLSGAPTAIAAEPLHSSEVVPHATSVRAEPALESDAVSAPTPAAAAASPSAARVVSTSEAERVSTGRRPVLATMEQPRTPLARVPAGESTPIATGTARVPAGESTPTASAHVHAREWTPTAVAHVHAPESTPTAVAQVQPPESTPTAVAHVQPPESTPTAVAHVQAPEWTPTAAAQVPPALEPPTVNANPAVVVVVDNGRVPTPSLRPRPDRPRPPSAEFATRHDGRPQPVPPATVDNANPTVQVRIGTLEVRNLPPEPAQPVPQEAGFDKFLALRSHAGWSR